MVAFVGKQGCLVDRATRGPNRNGLPRNIGNAEMLLLATPPPFHPHRRPHVGTCTSPPSLLESHVDDFFGGVGSGDGLLIVPLSKQCDALGGWAYS